MNIEKIEDLADLIIKVKLNVATPTQRERLNDWLYLNDENLKLYSNILSGDFIASKYMMEDENGELFNISQIKRKIVEKITQNRQKAIMRTFSLRGISAAAALVLLFFGTMIYRNIDDSKLLTQSEKHTKDIASKIVPYQTGEKPLLTTPEGEKIELNAEIDATIITKSQQAVNNAQNSISTPKGVTFNMTLSDGTRVWLNESSEITFPVTFEKNRREVAVVGEVYFEVKPDSLAPFFVKGSRSTTRVLGTKFNISNSETATITTLVEGSVEVSSEKTKMVITPSQQAHVTDDITITEVDINSIIAWKEGKYIFKSKSIEEIMNFLAGWYNITIEFDESVKRDLKMSGVIVKFNTFAEVIEILEATKLVEIKMKDANQAKIFAK